MIGSSRNVVPDDVDLEGQLRRAPLIPPELNPRNAFYGHSAIVKRYSGKPRYYTVKVSIEHGIYLSRQIDPGETATFLPICLCASSSRARYVRARIGADPALVAIGPLILYARPQSELPLGHSRLLAFPAHSSGARLPRYRIDDFISTLLGHQRDFDEVVVCVHHADILLRRHLPFLRAGLRCVTAGHGLSPDFLDRLRGYIESSTAVVTNGLGSHVLYALALNRPVWLRELVKDYWIAPDFPPTVDSELVRALVASLHHEVSSPTEQQLDAANELAGLDRHMTSAQLASVLDEAEQLYRSRVRRARRAGRMIKLWSRWPRELRRRTTEDTDQALALRSRLPAEGPPGAGPS